MKQGTAFLNAYVQPYKKKRVRLLAMAVLQVLCDIGVSLALKSIIDRALLRGSRVLLIVSCALFLLFALAQVFFSVRKQRTASQISEGAMLQLRKDLLTAYMNMSVSFRSRINGSELLTHCMQDVNALKELLSTRQVRLFTNTAAVLLLTATFLVLDWRLALVVIVFLPLFLLPAGYLGRKLPEAERCQKEADEKLNQEILQSVSGVEVIKHLDAAEDMEDRFAATVAKYKNRMLRKRTLESLREVSGSFLSVAMVGLFMVLGGWGFLRYRTSSTGTFLAFLTLIPVLFNAVSDLTALYLEGKRSRINLERINGILEAPAEPEGTLEVPEAPAAVSVENLSFRYENGNRVIHDAGFVIHPGEKVAVIGPSGSGKSTFAGMLAGLLEPENGNILFNGNPLSSYTGQARVKVVSMMSQAPVFWGETVKEIIAGTDDPEMFGVYEAAALAGFDEDAAQLPERYDTKLSEKVELSGGQRQRLALAALLYLNPGIMIMDEPTSALDRQSEKRLRALLKGPLAKHTVIILTHSRSLAEEADSVIRINDGTMIKEERTGMMDRDAGSSEGRVS